MRRQDGCPRLRSVHPPAWAKPKRNKLDEVELLAAGERLQHRHAPVFPVAAPAALSAASRVGPNGVGPIVIGTTPAQAAATGTLLHARGSSCYYLRPAAPAGVLLLVEDGTIRRVEVV